MKFKGFPFGQEMSFCKHLLNPLVRIPTFAMAS
jgi:hypothetical protein